MGDLAGLMEKIKSVTDQNSQKNLEEKLKEGKFSLEDVVEQIKSMNSLGGFDKIKSMIPGMDKAKIPDNALESQQEKISKWEHIIKSMTKYEKENPEILEKEHSRINRIAEGAGVNNSDIKSLLKQYKMLKEMIGSAEGMNMEEGGALSQKQMMKLAKKFGKKKMMRFR
jgi:signal recognition particle subunit SRP54